GTATFSKVLGCERKILQDQIYLKNAGIARNSLCVEEAAALRGKLSPALGSLSWLVAAVSAVQGSLVNTSQEKGYLSTFIFIRLRKGLIFP
ncbi:MAG: hypothetical protein ABFS17_00005, partial [Chloroflexota bacterium]